MSAPVTDATAPTAPPLTFEEATAAVTAPGQRFETATIDLDGRPTTVFANAPDTLRTWWASARQRPDDVYLVYEDEPVSYTHLTLPTIYSV